jgi:hypothetical protein
MFDPKKNREYGFTPVLISGYNPDVDISTTPETIWTGGGAYSFAGTAAALSVVSTSASDTQTITIVGLDEDYEPLEETITLTGTTPAVTTGEFLRVNSAVLSSAAVGAITAAGIHIPIGSLNQEAAVYTVPAGHTAFIKLAFASVQKAKDAHIDLLVNGATVWGVELYESAYHFPCYIRVGAESTIQMTAVNAATDNTRVHGGFELWLVKN